MRSAAFNALVIAKGERCTLELQASNTSPLCASLIVGYFSHRGHGEHSPRSAVKDWSEVPGSRRGMLLFKSVNTDGALASRALT